MKRPQISRNFAKTLRREERRSARTEGADARRRGTAEPRVLNLYYYYCIGSTTTLVQRIFGEVVRYVVRLGVGAVYASTSRPLRVARGVVVAPDNRESSILGCALVAPIVSFRAVLLWHLFVRLDGCTTTVQTIVDAVAADAIVHGQTITTAERSHLRPCSAANIALAAVCLARGLSIFPRWRQACSEA